MIMERQVRARARARARVSEQRETEVEKGVGKQRVKEGKLRQASSIKTPATFIEGA